MTARILVIKHGALGDIVLATGPMAAIRAHHPDAPISLLTTKPYVSFLAASGWFNDIKVDKRPKWWQLRENWKLLQWFEQGQFTRVYDLQTSSRSSTYFRLFPSPKPEWSGIAQGASHRHDTPHRTRTHTIERQKEQLSLAGITSVPAPDVSFLKADISHFYVHQRYALLVPGGSAHRPEKRWPETRFFELITWMAAHDIQPVLIGTNAEKPLLDALERLHPSVLNLCDATNFAEIASLARGAVHAVGNDTGPMHLIAAAGCPSVVLFSAVSDPALCAPRGKVQVLREHVLADLPASRVISALSDQMPS